MPMRSRSEDTRARLLAAARSEFAAHGMSGARVDRIAEHAGVNKERIYGHFGSKECLFAAVVAEALSEHAAKVGLPCGDPGEFAGRVFDFHRENPELTRLMMWEALHYGAGPLPDEDLRRGHYARKAAALAEATGAPLDDRAAASTFLAVIGIAVWPLAFPQMTRLVLGSNAEDPAHLRAYVVSLARKLSA
ncbi:AcrR family transcriptional regulator [Nocardiopsis mwathae]|uniref:AcrR family transcriptional regulator n=1 Tax=Nocardiopsis mwathae TaxID=1472723 RepID=A0A7X0D8C1_9ACTN|nr:TetR family transcriptional regulator [Nocardiopsis mwathae]MBB6174606.1 AcrR family transcriptional regulator [Nocardiopsis mwathae]